MDCFGCITYNPNRNLDEKTNWVKMVYIFCWFSYIIDSYTNPAVTARWPSGLRRNVKVSLILKHQLPLSSGVGSNPTLVTSFLLLDFVGHVAMQYAQTRHVVLPVTVHHVSSIF